LNGDAEIDGPEFFELETYSHLAMDGNRWADVYRPDGPQPGTEDISSFGRPIF